MKKQQPKKKAAAAWAIILERGYSEAYIEKIGKVGSLKALIPHFQKWLASDSPFGIVAVPMRQGEVNVRTAHIAQREDLPEAIRQIAEYLSGIVGVGKRLSFGQGGTLAAETQEIIRQTLGSLPPPEAFN